MMGRAMGHLLAVGRLRERAARRRAAATAAARRLQGRAAAHHRHHAVVQRRRHDRRGAGQRPRPGLRRPRAHRRRRRLDGRHGGDPARGAGHPLHLRARPRPRARDEQGHRDGVGRDRRRAQRGRPLPPRRARRRRAAPSRAARRASGSPAAASSSTATGAEIRRPDHRLQELAAAPLLARALPDAELRLRAGDVLPPRGAAGDRRLRRALPHLRRLRPAAALRAARRPDRAGARPRVLPHGRGHAEHGRLRDAVPRARRAGAAARRRAPAARARQPDDEPRDRARPIAA